LKIEQLGEELRLLYVAFTRACDLLILTGSASETKLQRWQNAARAPLTPRSLVSTQMPLEWVAQWWFRNTPEAERKADKGRNEHLRWQRHASDLRADQQPSAAPEPAAPLEPAVSSETLLQQWKRLKDVAYPARAATLEPAKTHVSALRQRAALEADAPAEAHVLSQARPWFSPQGNWSEQARGMKAGSAHHAFLEHVPLDVEPTEENFKEQARHMLQRGLLTEEEVRQLNWAGLAHFWKSEVGCKIRTHPASVQREIPFTARVTAADLQGLGIPVQSELGPDEFMVVQGVADLVVLLENEIWVLDYKTDHLTAEQVEQRAQFYAPQVRLYALALSRIFQRRATQVWLHFLAPGVTVTVPPPA
jgi:ATP-dependent helicase/nuclease subunit A